MNIVICGSFSPSTIPNIKRMRDFLLLIISRTVMNIDSENIQAKFWGVDFSKYVYPTDEHLKSSEPCIRIHHEGIGEESNNSIELRNSLMNLYFRAIDNADLVFVYNLKDCKEHIGAGALMEIGYAHAKQKRIYFLIKLTEANVVSIFAGKPEYLLEMI